MPDNLDNLESEWSCPICQNVFCLKHLKDRNFDLPLHGLHEKEVTCVGKVKDIGIDDLV